MHSEQRNVMLLGQVAPYRVSSLLRKLIVVGVLTYRVRESFDLENEVRFVLDLRCQLIERLLSLRRQLITVEFESHRRCILKRVVIKVGSQIGHRLLRVFCNGTGSAKTSALSRMPPSA